MAILVRLQGVLHVGQRALDVAARGGAGPVWSDTDSWSANGLGTTAVRAVVPPL